MIYSLEDKTKKELVEICNIQIEEYQLLTKRIAELEKERDEANCHAYYILETCMVFSPANFEAHNLEQQAKGVGDAINNSPSRLNFALPLVDTTELYDYANGLQEQANQAKGGAE